MYWCIQNERGVKKREIKKKATSQQKNDKERSKSKNNINNWNLLALRTGKLYILRARAYTAKLKIPFPLIMVS